MTLVITNENNRRETHYNVSKIEDTGIAIKIYYSDKLKAVELFGAAIKINKLILS